MGLALAVETAVAVLGSHVARCRVRCKRAFEDERRLSDWVKSPDFTPQLFGDRLYE